MNARRVGIHSVRVRIDQVDRHTQIMFRQKFVFVGAFQRGRVVLDETSLLERISDDFGFEGDVG